MLSISVSVCRCGRLTYAITVGTVCTGGAWPSPGPDSYRCSVSSDRSESDKQSIVHKASMSDVRPTILAESSEW